MFSAPVSGYGIDLKSFISFTEKVTGKEVTQTLAVLKAEDKLFPGVKFSKLFLKTDKASLVVIKAYDGNNFKVAVKYSSGMRVLVGVNSHKQAGFHDISFLVCY